MSALEDLAAPDVIGAAEELAVLLDLPTVELSIRGARVIGRGARASADLFLSDGSTLTFETLRDVGTPAKLILEVAACTGAEPRLKAPQAIRAVALLRSIAEHHETFTADQVAFEWGSTFLQEAHTMDVNIDDQAERWKAFSALDHIDPVAARFRGESATVAAGSYVLRHRTGQRLVRCGWLREHVRGEENVSGTEIALRMLRVGWTRRGKDGRVKASRPGYRDELVWTFYNVAAGWENAS